MITILAGTNRPQSQTLRVAKIYKGLFDTHKVETQILDLNTLPASIFSPSAYATKPPEFAPFNDAILKSEGVLIVTPEYNGSFPGVLKYFIDMLKFPESFENRPVAFVGVSAGRFGALRSIEQLELILKYRNAHVFNERVMLPGIEKQLDAHDKFTDPLIQELAPRQVKNFIKYCQVLK